MMSRYKFILVASVAVFSLSGCSYLGFGQEEEIQEWVAQARRETKVVLKPIQPPREFVPFTYARQDEIDPFNSQKLSVAFAKAKARSDNGLQPDMDRRREPLEQYPLDAITMVGMIKDAGKTYAVLEADGTIYKVMVGNYIGQNFGQIINIDETELTLKEHVIDTAGEWTVREVKLELQEADGQTQKSGNSRK